MLDNNIGITMLVTICLVYIVKIITFMIMRYIFRHACMYIYGFVLDHILHTVNVLVLTSLALQHF